LGEKISLKAIALLLLFSLFLSGTFVFAQTDANSPDANLPTLNTDANQSTIDNNSILQEEQKNDDLNQIVPENNAPLAVYSKQFPKKSLCLGLLFFISVKTISWIL